MARNYSNTTVETTLVNAVGSSDTLIRVNDTTGMPITFPFSLILDYQGSNVEVVTVTGSSGPDFTVTRGEDGTGAQAHDAGAVVVHGGTARDFFEPQQHIDATSAHGVGGTADVVGTDTTQTLTNKSIDGTANTLDNVTATAVSGVNLGDLTDVNAVTPADRDFLEFDSGAGLWVLLSPQMVDRQVFENDGTWNKPAGARWVRVQCQAKGGGGGGSFTGSGAPRASAGIGGGGGEYREGVFSADALGSSESVTMDGAGVATSFGIHIVAQPGDNGTSFQATVDFAASGAAGGTGGTGGDIVIRGGGGGAGIVLAGTVAIGGYGGGSFLGDGGVQIARGSSGNTVGALGRGWGSGGGGSVTVGPNSSASGGNPATGLCIVTTYF